MDVQDLYAPEALWNIFDRPGSACNTEYNSKWRTSLIAIDEMLSYKIDIPQKVKELLYAFKAERAMWLLTTCVISSNYSYNEYSYYKKILSKYGRYLIKRERRLKTILQCFIYTCCPIFILKPMLIRIKEKNK